MVKLTVLYDQPQDAEAFEKYYLEHHVPGGAKLPNLIRFEINKAVAAPGEKPVYYRTADLYFDDMASLQECLASPTGQAGVADLDNFAKGGYKVLIAEVQTVKLAAPAHA